MYKEKKVGVIIAAAGNGSRMRSSVPKQFIEIQGEPMLAITCRAFLTHPLVDHVVITSGSDYIEETREIMARLETGIEDSPSWTVVTGGASRQESVYNAVRFMAEEERPDLVLIHDGARPFVSSRIITDCIEGTLEHGLCTAAVTPKNTIRTEKETLDRKSLYEVHTPQGFAMELLKEAHERALKEGYSGTDDISLAERLGYVPFLVEDDYSNYKVTTPEDLPAKPVIPRVGSGQDFHRLVPDRALILGGVNIPYELGLLGHSDADVLTHAIMDALLGAAALGDIGKAFPDNDPAYKDADSIRLLQQVAAMVKARGYEIGNIDGTLIAQRPKISGYTEEMRRNIAGACGVDPGCVNIKATTTEKMGFTGSGEGMAATAAALIYPRQ